MEKTFCIYKHTNLINNKVYIGQTSQSPERRWRQGGTGYKDSPRFWQAIQHYGWDNFSHEILQTNLTQQKANIKEKYWISFYNSMDQKYGYNLTPGGDNYMKELWANEKYREKMIESFKRARKKSWEDPKFREEVQKRLLNGVAKAWNDPDWRAKRIQNITGSKNPNAKAVVNKQTGLIFLTIKQAAEWSGLASISGIGQCCRGKQKSAGHHPQTGIPLHWEWYKGGEKKE